MIRKLAPLVTALTVIVWAAFSQSNVNGYVLAFLLALVVGVIFAKDEKEYGEAVVYGLSKPIFSIIVLAVVLASVSGKLISASGVIETLAYYIVSAGFGGRLFVAATFIITCLLAFSTGTSVGTYFVVIPILFPVGVMAGAAPEFMLGAICAGAAFGDNLGPISDTTIASSQTQHAELGEVVRTRTAYSIPAAVSALILFLVFTKETDTSALTESVQGSGNPMSLFMLIVPITVIILCLLKKHLITALSYGIVSGIAVGLILRIYTIEDLIKFPGGFSVEGIIISAVTGTSGTVFMLIMVFALLGVMEKSGLFEDIGRLMKRFSKGRRSTEASIVVSIGLLSMITGVISVAIVTLGDLIDEIGNKAGIDKCRRANLMDCTGCVFCFLSPWTVHCVIPAQLSGQAYEAAAVAPSAIPLVNYYSISMLVILVIAIVTGYGSRSRKG